MLSLGAALLGAAYVTSVDIDSSALEVYKENVEEMELTNVDGLQCDFLNPYVCRLAGTSISNLCFDQTNYFHIIGKPHESVHSCK